MVFTESGRENGFKRSAPVERLILQRLYSIGDRDIFQVLTIEQKRCREWRLLRFPAFTDVRADPKNAEVPMVAPPGIVTEVRPVSRKAIRPMVFQPIREVDLCQVLASIKGDLIN